MIRALRRHGAITAHQSAILKSDGGSTSVFRFDLLLQRINSRRDLNCAAKDMVHEIDLMDELRHYHAAARDFPLPPPRAALLCRLGCTVFGFSRWSFPFGEAAEPAKEQAAKTSLVTKPERTLHFRQITELINSGELS